MKFFGRRSAPPVDDGAAAEPEPPRRSFSVVVVDDEDVLRDLMVLGLSSAGFDVVGQAGDGAHALEVVAATRPDMVLLDLHLPDIGGLELLPLLRAESPRSKVVIISAISATRMLEATLDAGAAAFIEKGVSMRSICLHLERVATSGSVKVVRPYPLNHDYSAGLT